MPRPHRNILPDRIYLVSQQGNKRHPVYVDDQDRAFATRLLRICAMRYGVKVLAFGYGDYEGRWLLKPSNRRGISCLMRDMQSMYSRYLNEKYDHRPCCAHRRGKSTSHCHDLDEPIRNSSNWTARFKATEIDPEHLYDALAYIRNLNCRTSRAYKAFPGVEWSIRAALHRSVPLRRILSHTRQLASADVRAP